MNEKNVLFVVSECQKFAVTGGLADVAGSLPRAINDLKDNYKVHVIMPLYKDVFLKHSQDLKLIGLKNIRLSWRNQEAKIYYLMYENINYYFVGNDYYYNRDNIYGYLDDIERFAFLCLATINVFDIIGFTPIIIHAHDWHGALVNIYLKLMPNDKYENIKTVLTIHNIQYQGIFNISSLEDITGIDLKYLDILEHNGLINLLKGGIVCSDLVTTVSPSYAKEIQMAKYSYGLEEIIKKHKDKLIGIINGIDYEFYNPEKDENLLINYNINTFSSKIGNKLKIQRDLNLEVNENIVLIAIVSRLVAHKGMDLIIESFQEIINENVQIIILGLGEEVYEEKFKIFASQYPHKVATLLKFDINLAKEIYGSADFFLMPSATEPCGLSQMIASRYGTIPIVRKTGGLGDSIKDYYEEGGNGFVFNKYSKKAMLVKIKQAIRLYKNPDEFNLLVEKVLKEDFSWRKSAKEHINIYNKLLLID